MSKGVEDMLKIFEALKSPERFAPSPDNIWTNEEIAPFIFQSYFNNAIYGGSKNEQFVEKAVEYINSIAKEHSCKSILDLGCGPGVYTVPLAELGYEVRGVDFSEKAINYAETNKNEQLRNLNHTVGNILTFRSNIKYDMVLLLYETYSSFNKKDRATLLNNITNNIKNNGIFILDIASDKRFSEQSPAKGWQFFNARELFIEKPHYLFFSIEKYPNNLILHHSIFLFENQDIINCYDWIQCFDKNSIIKELENSNFTILNIHNNTYGDLYSDDTHSISILCKKNG